MNKKLLRELPKVDDLLLDSKIASALKTFGRKPVIKSIRSVLDQTRQAILSGQINDDRLDIDNLLSAILERVALDAQMNLKPVINATGVVLHTNLGRAPLAPAVWQAVSEIACQYNTLEYDVSSGGRGSRYSHVESLICEITGAEAALVVNNNAAAMMLILSALAKGGEVVVSRGELVEIGGSFRVPEIMAQSGAILREVGTTNKTHLRDYAAAIDDENCAMLLKVHTSNYRIVGFTEEVSLEQLAELGKAHGFPVVYDLGSGLVEGFNAPLFESEISVLQSVASGVDVVSFSGDKLLGGPQAGIIIGRKNLIEKMKAHPLTRAFRIDKLTLAALEATLRIYRDADSAKSAVPILQMLTMSEAELADRATKLYEMLKAVEAHCSVAIEAGTSQVGGGSMPTVEPATSVIALRPKTLSVHALQKALRMTAKPIVVRAVNDCVYLDVRTIAESDYDYIVESISKILNGKR
ncbi:MAG: L-seryl-tRNA(Sec) selenium transferase [Clostridiales bacterium]|nr:MAG: L-seryl-tRNA(Sec) selenium transferase [Clostridiales bacterium]